MHHFFDAITNTKGDALIGFYVRVVDSSGTGVALYADTSLTPIVSVSGVADAAKVDSDGNVDFYVAVGTYRIDIYATDSTTLIKSISDVGMNIDMDTAALATAAQTAASASASAAATSETNSATSATTATTQAGIATTQAGIATTEAGVATTQAGIATAASAAIGTSISSVPNATAHASTRTVLAALSTTGGPAYLAESGREGTFVFDSSNLSAKVTADPSQGIYVAPSSDATGASGAWVRKWDGSRAQAKWWGGTWDGIANDGPVGLAAITALFSFAGANLTGFGTACPSLVFPFNPTKIRMGTSTLSLTQAIALLGENGGTIGGDATHLKWDANCNGIEVHAANCYFDGLSLEGDMIATPVEGEYHGIKAYFKFGYGRLSVYNWQGDGVHENVTAGSGGDTEGNDNGTYGLVLNTLGNRRGLSIEGGDANASHYAFIDANFNRQAGVYDASGLGNGYGTVQTAGNGVDGKSTCFNNGHVFYVISGQEAGASTNSPPTTATSNTWWGFWENVAAATASYPQWTTGQTWRVGGGFVVPLAALSNRSTVGHLYVESDQPPTQTAQCVILGGGTRGIADAPATRSIQADSTGLTIRPAVSSASASIDNLQVNSGAVIQNGVDLTLFSGFNGGNFIGIGVAKNFGGVIKPGLLSSNTGSGAQPFWLDSSELQWIYGGDGFSHWTLNSTGMSVVGTVAATGAVTGSNLSGTNTGDETAATITAKLPAFTGDVTSVAGTAALTIGANKVTFAKMQALSAGGKLIGSAVGSTAAAEISIGTGLTIGTATLRLANVSASVLYGNPTGAATTPSEITLAGGLAFSGTTLTVGALTPTSIAATGAITSSGGGVGYATGAGGAVTQATSKATGVTLSKLSGQITMNAAALASAALVSFVVTNTLVAATDTINLNLQSGNVTAGTYRYWIDKVSAGSFVVAVENRSAGSLSEAIVWNFAVVKAVAA